MNEKLAEQHAKLFDEITAEQTKNLETMESRRIWAEGRIATHGDRSLRITSRISRAVGNLQVGDSTRQRVEHVEETLQSLHEIDDEFGYHHGRAFRDLKNESLPEIRAFVQETV